MPTDVPNILADDAIVIDSDSDDENVANQVSAQSAARDDGGSENQTTGKHEYTQREWEDELERRKIQEIPDPEYLNMGKRPEYFSGKPLSPEDEKWWQKYTLPLRRTLSP